MRYKIDLNKISEEIDMIDIHIGDNRFKLSEIKGRLKTLKISNIAVKTDEISVYPICGNSIEIN